MTAGGRAQRWEDGASREWGEGGGNLEMEAETVSDELLDAAPGHSGSGVCARTVGGDRRRHGCGACVTAVARVEWWSGGGGREEGEEEEEEQQQEEEEQEEEQKRREALIAIDPRSGYHPQALRALTGARR